MIGKRQGMAKPTVLGTLVQAATYGMTIPTIYGTTQSNLLVIWASNLRQGSSSKKNKKKGITTYLEAVDFLIGSNPILGCLQTWNNGNIGILNFVKYSVTPYSGGTAAITIPDAAFYALLAVTFEFTNEGTFYDYGGNGPSAYNNTSEFPLYNCFQAGPGPTDATYSRRWPFIYTWSPAAGNVVTFPSLDRSLTTTNYGIPGFNRNIHFYYAQIPSQFGRAPMAINNLSFESTLGSGSEYAGFTEQQIEYPEYAGVGSPDCDLGAAAAIPDFQIEVSGSFARFPPRGDADFCDMIEDTIKSGVMQVGAQLGLIQRGVNLNTLPGAVDKMQSVQFESGGQTESYWTGFQQPIQKGQILFVLVNWALIEAASGTPTISDSAGNTWINVFITDLSGLWYAIASSNFPAGNNIAVHGNGTPAVSVSQHAKAWVMDPDSNEINAVTTNTGPLVTDPTTMSCSITVTQAPAIILACAVAQFGWFPDGTNATTAPALPPLWNDLFYQPFPSLVSNTSVVAYRIVSAPGTYTFTLQNGVGGAGAAWNIGMIAVNASQPGQIPKTLGDIIDYNSLELCRQQCQANGLWGSVSMNSQKSASDWLKEFATCANLAYVWSGFVLKFIPRSEVSTVGNGAVYIAPTAAGPVATLPGSAFIDQGGSLIEVERRAQVDSNNIKQVQFFDRNANYNQSTASEPVSGAIALYGPRKEAAMVLPEIQDASVARTVLAVEVRRLVLLRNVYKFTMKANWLFLEAMDLILVNDSKIGITNLPVRLTSITENDQYELECEAEPFYYGCNAPTVLPVTSAAPFSSGGSASPGSVNPPIFFEPPTRMLEQQNQAQLWIVVSGNSPNYGGCIVEISTDGGSTYNPVGAIQGSAPTGYLNQDWPAASDPDTTNNLSVDLSESLGVLPNHSVTDEDNFVYPCIVMPGLTCIPYELMTYAVADLVGSYQYVLVASTLPPPPEEPGSSGTGIAAAAISQKAFTTNIVPNPSSFDQGELL